MISGTPIRIYSFHLRVLIWNFKCSQKKETDKLMWQLSFVVLNIHIVHPFPHLPMCAALQTYGVEHIKFSEEDPYNVTHKLMEWRVYNVASNFISLPQNAEPLFWSGRTYLLSNQFAENCQLGKVTEKTNDRYNDQQDTFANLSLPTYLHISLIRSYFVQHGNEYGCFSIYLWPNNVALVFSLYSFFLIYRNGVYVFMLSTMELNVLTFRVLKSQWIKWLHWFSLYEVDLQVGSISSGLQDMLKHTTSFLQRFLASFIRILRMEGCQLSLGFGFHC